jgi:hypothetical protein
MDQTLIGYALQWKSELFTNALVVGNIANGLHLMASSMIKRLVLS